MKCPLKPVKILKDEYGHLLSNKPKETPAKVETDFGECDFRQCMAYNSATAKCEMMNMRSKNYG